MRCPLPCSEPNRDWLRSSSSLLALPEATPGRPAREQLPRQTRVRGFLAARGLLRRRARARSVWPRILIATQVALALALLAVLALVLHPSHSCAPGQPASSAARVQVACATTVGSVHPAGK